MAHLSVTVHRQPVAVEALLTVAVLMVCLLTCRSPAAAKSSPAVQAVPDHGPLDIDLQSSSSFTENHSQAASGEQASELDMQEVQQVLDSADERTLQAEQRALKAEEAAQVHSSLHQHCMAGSCT